VNYYIFRLDDDEIPTPNLIFNLKKYVSKKKRYLEYEDMKHLFTIIKNIFPALYLFLDQLFIEEIDK